MKLREGLDSAARWAQPFAERASANADKVRAEYRSRSRQLMARPRPVPLFDDPKYLLAMIAIIAIVAIFLDVPVAKAMRAAGDPTGFFWRVTDLGLSGWVLVPTGIVFLLSLMIDQSAVSRRAAVTVATIGGVAGYFFIAVGGSGLLSVTLKYVIGRPRPKLMESIGAFDITPFTLDAAHASFPSGHATTAGAFAVAMALFAPRWRAALVVLAVVVAMSRVMIGVHFPSDVMAGLLIGALIAHRTAVAAAQRRMVFEVDGDGTIKARGMRALAASGGLFGALKLIAKAHGVANGRAAGAAIEKADDYHDDSRSVQTSDQSTGADAGAGSERDRSVS
ncbi:MAG: phosphatase PAP2 family protein [Hyphomicrobiales bacterium]|nr:phosphatase PAP2 family protein [Hyphomicrobiales bacterium]